MAGLTRESSTFNGASAADERAPLPPREPCRGLLEAVTSGKVGAPGITAAAPRRAAGTCGGDGLRLVSVTVDSCGGAGPRCGWLASAAGHSTKSAMTCGGQLPTLNNPAE